MDNFKKAEKIMGLLMGGLSIAGGIYKLVKLFRKDREITENDNKTAVKEDETEEEDSCDEDNFNIENDLDDISEILPNNSSLSTNENNSCQPFSVKFNFGFEINGSNINPFNFFKVKKN